MNDKAALLDQLRIDRTQPAPERNIGWRWPVGLGAAALAALAAVWSMAHPGISVHAVIAKALPDAAAGASLLDASGYASRCDRRLFRPRAPTRLWRCWSRKGRPSQANSWLDWTTPTPEPRASNRRRRSNSFRRLSMPPGWRCGCPPSFMRNQAQLAEGLISPEAFDAAKSSYDAAQTAELVAEQNLAVAKAAEDVNQRYEDDTVIKSPFDGVVTVKTAQPGEIVSPQFLGGGGIAKIVDMESLEVDVDVGENFINRVHSKQPAEVTLNAYPDWRIPAEVIAVIPTAERSKATVKVRIGFKQKDARIVPEMGARVSFLEQPAAPQAKVAPRKSGVFIPVEAVRGDGTAGVVFVINGDAVERRAVRLGARTAEGQTILAGLQAGTTVAIGDLSKLSDRTRVRVTP